MKFLWLGVAALVAGANLRHEEPDTTILIGGTTHGYLSPCGCTKPMSGGIRRRIAMLRTLSEGKTAIVLENGGLVHGKGRQDEIKAETLAESLKTVGAIINLTVSEVELGGPMIEAIDRLSGNAFVSGSFEGIAEHRVSGSFVIGGASLREAPSRAPLAVAGRLVEAATPLGKKPILMLDAPIETAREVARAHPALAAIVFRSAGDPAPEAERVGNTMLVTPGEKGKHVIKLTATGGKITGYLAIKLGPDVTDDPAAARAYGRYLDRIVSEKLLERLPRAPGPAFSGTKACGQCHAASYQKWKKSAHAHALETLEKEKHDRDPDCVECHVVGLPMETGFVDRIKTPNLADVGCESCHGAGAEHSANPLKSKMPKLGEKICLTCHTRDASPNFDFATAWAKVIHK